MKQIARDPRLPGRRISAKFVTRFQDRSNLDQQTPSPPPGESDDDTTNLRHRHIDNPADDYSSNDDHDKYDYDDTTFAYHERIQDDCQPVQIA
ncbi:hypothetical protein O988_05391 [Pseudogymnoascus sp. VKM F-3808]|nr:hypothetical protein O988_05391 [Pseudogymnoascus sp. VKM F-3808]